MEIYSTVWKGLKENQQCTNGYYLVSLTNIFWNKKVQMSLFLSLVKKVPMESVPVLPYSQWMDLDTENKYSIPPKILFVRYIKPCDARKSVYFTLLWSA